MVENGLYPLAFNNTSTNKLQCHTDTVGVKASLNRWHSRLGHPATSVLRNLVHSHNLPSLNSANKLDFCNSCQPGKVKQLSFPSSDRHTTRCLELVHSNVWVAPISSISRSKFYVLFIDDFSRFSWLYPLYHKSDVFPPFVKFKVLVEILFSTSIKQFQYDNGGEFLSSQFKDLFTKCRIYHRLTCPYTSQQNGVAERKHRHIQEMGLTLLADSGLSQNYWVDAFQT